MTRKDYILIAEALAKARVIIATDYAPDETLQRHIAHNAWKQTTYQVCKALGSDNNAFDRGRFLMACGVQS